MAFDVDAHVEESIETRKYLEEKYSRRRPVPVTLEDQPALLGQNSFWLIDGAIVPRTSGKGLSLFGTPTTSRHAREKAFLDWQPGAERRRPPESAIWINSAGSIRQGGFGTTLSTTPTSS